MAYGLHDLELTGLQVKTILSLQIFHKPGEHGKMELHADLGEENGDFPIHETSSGQKITLYEKRDGKKNPIFSGVITGLLVQSEGKSFHVKVTAYTHSYLMDIQKKSRSFQDTTMTLGMLVSGIVKDYGGQSQILFADSAIGEIAVQYDETDWHFIKRMLSERHIPLACSEIRDNVCLYMGVARIPAKPEILSVEKVWKDMDELSYWREAGEGLAEENFIAYRIRLDNHMTLYGDIDFRGRSLTAAEVEYATIDNTVYEFVTLKKNSGILQKTIYPMELVGSAMEGTILNVKGEKVQIHLKIDDDHPGNDCYWFPFSTPSASSDGSGWYCMPEKGDQVRIYFPSKRTKEVIAISAVSTYDPSSKGTSQSSAGAGSSQGSRGGGGQSGSGSSNGGGYAGGGGSDGGGYAGGGGSDGGGYTGGGGSGSDGYSGGGGGAGSGAAAGAAAAGVAAPAADAAKGKDAGKDKMSDPTTKYLRVPSGQQIKLSPKGIEVLCSGGSVSIEILKSGRINIYADDSIQISAENDIRLKAKYTVQAYCKETAYLASQMGGCIYLNEEGKMIIQGTEVHMN